MSHQRDGGDLKMGYIYVLQRGLQPLIFTVKASTIQAVLSFAIASH